MAVPGGGRSKVSGGSPSDSRCRYNLRSAFGPAVIADQAPQRNTRIHVPPTVAGPIPNTRWLPGEPYRASGFPSPLTAACGPRDSAPNKPLCRGCPRRGTPGPAIVDRCGKGRLDRHACGSRALSSGRGSSGKRNYGAGIGRRRPSVPSCYGQIGRHVTRSVRVAITAPRKIIRAHGLPVLDQMDPPAVVSAERTGQQLHGIAHHAGATCPSLARCSCTSDHDSHRAGVLSRL